MRRAELASAWYSSPYTGLFSECGAVPREAHDPDVAIWSGTTAGGSQGVSPAAGGAGWDDSMAEAAGVGEALERWQARPLPCDRAITTSFRRWPLDESAIAPERWVLFHPDQYALPGFPFKPFTVDTVCRWTCFRQALSGLPSWVPEELAFLSLPAGRWASLTPLLSTGLSCGRWGQPVLLRGLQEVIERDAVVGAAWERYPLEEHAPESVFAALPRELRRRLERPNLKYRFYRIQTPLSAHVTVVTLEGEDRPGRVFSTGAACRESRVAAWLKSLLEAVQGRHYVRYVMGWNPAPSETLEIPATFPEHALYYSVHPERRTETLLGRVAPTWADDDAHRVEDIAELVERLGPDRPVLFRNLTPPGIAAERLGWYVLRVVVPGLQPLHGHHELPFLGGPLWAPRRWRDWVHMPPHPYG